MRRRFVVGVGGGEDGRARRSLLGEDGQARLWADNWFSDALKDFGHPIRARIWWLALRIGGWRAWQLHRSKNHPLSEDGARGTVPPCARLSWLP